MSKTEKSESKYIISREELAEMLLISPAEINKLWKNHGLPKEERGVYDLKKVIPFVIRRKNAQIEAQKHGDLTKADAERQLRIFEMELLRIELAEKQKLTISIEDVEKILMPAIIATSKKINVLVKQILTTFPKDELRELRKAREEKIYKIVTQIRNELANVPKQLK